MMKWLLKSIQFSKVNLNLQKSILTKSIWTSEIKLKLKSKLNLKSIWKEDQYTMMNVITTYNGPMNPNDGKSGKSNWMVEGNEWMNLSMNRALETCNQWSLTDLEWAWIQEWSEV